MPITKQPLEEMTAEQLQTQLDSTQAKITADTEEYSGLTAKMIAAAENGESEEWTRLHFLFNSLPTKLAGQNLRLLSIRILLKEKQLIEAQADVDTTGAPLEELREKADAAKKDTTKRSGKIRIDTTVGMTHEKTWQRFDTNAKTYKPRPQNQVCQ
jgi:hypothetical protein